MKDKKMMDSTSVRFAKKEFKILRAQSKDHSKEGDEMQDLIEDEICHLLRIFDDQGHSGFSAAYVLHAFNRLANFLPLTPLTGAEDEWGEPYSIGERELMQQNLRCSKVFRRYKDNNTATCIGKYTISDNGGITWFTGCSTLEKLGYNNKIAFPYMVPEHPKKIYLKHTTPVKLGFFNTDDVVDITDKPDEIKKLYEESRKMFDAVEFEKEKTPLKKKADPNANGGSK